MLLDKLFERPMVKTQLHKDYQDICNKYGGLSHKDIKKALGITELEVVDQQLGLRSIALQDNFSAIINSLSSLGYTATRIYNNAVIQESKGFYMTKMCANNISTIVANAKEAGVKLSLDNWQCIYAVREMTELGYRYSLQVFDVGGEAIQKVFLQPQSNFYAYEDIINDYKDDGLKTNKPQIERPILSIRNDMNIDVRELILDWRKEQSIHHAEELTKKYNISYQEIYRYIGDVYAEEFSVKKLELIMEQVLDRKMPMTFSVPNHSAVQYYSGVLDNVYASGDYLHCMATDFSLRILETGIANAWLVRKATLLGIVTSLEFYDYYGNQLLKVHGQHDQKYGESIHWKRLAESTLQYCSSGYLMGANKSNTAYVASNMS